MSERAMLRHTLATLSYRGGKAIREAPARFADFRGGPGARTAGEILAHIGDLLVWALSLAKGQEAWSEGPPKLWDEEVMRFFAGLSALDDYLASDQPLGCPPEQLFQGPVADALTHVGQITLLRRLSGAPIRSENYSRAEIVAGRVGPEQSSPRREFD